MEQRLIIFIVIAIIFLIFTIFLKISLITFNNQFSEKIESNKNAILELERFSFKIYFDPPKSTIDITNPYTCTPQDLKICELSNQSSCIGCKNLITTCIHFDVDTKYIDFDGAELTIPANTTEDEGYCLVQNNPSQTCNPYHGDLVLVQLEPDSTESMLFCECKNPGYIGKLELNGACDTVFICDGNIDDINKPLAEINCICNEQSTNSNENNVPVCLPKKVKDFTYYDRFFFEGRHYTDIDKFSSDIRTFPGEILNDPCKYCLITGRYISNGRIVESDDGYQCAILNASGRGLPIRRNANYRVLSGTEGPDAILDLDVHSVLVYGYIDNAKYERMVVKILHKNNKDILQRMGIYDSDVKAYSMIDVNSSQLVWPGSFGYSYFTEMPVVICDGTRAPSIIGDFIYYCAFRHTVPDDRIPRFDSYKFNTSEFAFNLTSTCPTMKHPFFMNFSYKKWKFYEGFNSIFSINDKYKTNKLRKLEMKEDFKIEGWLKYVFTNYKLKDQKAKGYCANSTDFHNYYKAGLIPKDPSNWEI